MFVHFIQVVATPMQGIADLLAMGVFGFTVGCAELTVGSDLRARIPHAALPRLRRHRSTRSALI